MIASRAIARERQPWRSPVSCMRIVPRAPRMSPMCASSRTGGIPAAAGDAAPEDSGASPPVVSVVCSSVMYVTSFAKPWDRHSAHGARERGLVPWRWLGQEGRARHACEELGTSWLFLIHAGLLGT